MKKQLPTLGRPLTILLGIMILWAATITSVFAFSYGDRVQSTTDGLNIHSSDYLSSTVIDHANTGDKGTVEGGPYYDSVSGYYFYYVVWDTHSAGYSVQNYLQLITSTPTITSVSPNPATGSNSGQTLTINGSGFVSGAQVKLVWPAVGVTSGGSATLAATFISSSQLQITATLGTDPSSWTAQVINPGNITSATYGFSLQAPFPVIQFLSPNSVPVGGSTFTLTVNGSTFDQGSIVYWNGVSLPTTPVVTSGGLITVLQAQVPASDIASAGTATVTVFNPSPGGGTSVGVSFNIGTSSTTTSQGVDYSVNSPNLSALKAAGYGFVIRYVSAAGNAKNITSSEVQALQAAGLGIIVVFESTANEMQNGYSAGVADANTAVTTATAAGAPANFFCYFACDFDAQPSDQTAINAYLDGAASVLGVQRVGFYGGYTPLKNVLDAGKAAKGWQTTAWSHGNIDPRISLYQYLYSQTSAGGSYDIDEGFGSDLGQWSATPIDTTPPALTISSPANNATVTSASLAVSGMASDSGLGNNGVSSVTVNGIGATGGTATGSGTATWNAMVTLVSGANTIAVIAKDTLNNSTTKQITVTYNPPDTIPPTVAISSPTSGQTFTTSPVTVSGTATDPGSPSSGVSLVQVQVNSTSGTWQTASGTTSWSASVALSSGANTIYVRSQDGAGNYSTIASVNVTYNPPDTTPPTVSISNPTSGQTFTASPVTVSGTATDPGSPSTGVSLVQVQVDGTGGTWQTASGTTSWTASVALVSGANTIYVRSQDGAGNYSTIASVKVTYAPDTQGPALTISSPLNNATVTSASLPVSGTASDNGNGNNGVSSVTVNGVSVTGGTTSGTGTAYWNATIPLNAGANTVTVVAKDTLNNPSQQQINVTYNPPRPVFGGSFVSGGQWQTTLSGLSVGETVVLQASTDLKNWTPAQTKVANGSTLTFTSTVNSALKGQYFRVMVQ